MRFSILIIFAINLYGIRTEEYTIVKCYEIVNSEGERFNLHYASHMTLFPSYIYVEYEIFDPVFGGKGQNMQRFDARLVDSPCPDSRIIFPNILKKRGDKQRMSLRVYYGRRDYEIDRFIADVEFGYPSLDDEIIGLFGSLRLPVHFSTTVNELRTYELSTHEYYRKLPKLRENESYCIKMLGSKAGFLLKIDGQELRDNDAYDTYVMNIIGYTESGETITKHFFVKTSICDRFKETDQATIFTDYSIIRVVAELMDGQKRQILRAVYFSRHHHFYLDDTAGNIEIGTLNIQQEDIELALLEDKAIYLYQAQHKRIWCKDKQYMSFVDVLEKEDTFIKIAPMIGEHSGGSDKITKIKPGLISEVERCLQEGSL